MIKVQVLTAKHAYLRRYKKHIALNLSYFLARRISFKSKRTFSKLIVRIAIVGIALGLGIMILTLAILKGFKQEIREKIRGFSGDMMVLKYDLNNSYENSPFKNDSTFLIKAKSNPYINKVMPFATKPGIIKANGEIEGVLLKGVDKTYDWTFFKKSLRSGTVLNFGDSTEVKKQLLISQTIANSLKLKVGDKIIMYFIQEPIRRRQFVIKGIFNFGIEDVDKSYVIGDISLITRLNNWNPDEVGGYEIKINNFNKLRETEEIVNGLLPTKLKSYTVTDTYPAIFSWLDLLDGNTNVVLGLMIIVAVINMISALLIMILERTNFIGIIKAMGARNWVIQKIFLYNAIYLIAIGMLIGNIWGFGFGLLQQQTHFFKLKEATYYMSFVPIQFDIGDWIFLNAGTAFICILVMLGPSMLVTKITPVKAIRFK